MESHVADACNVADAVHPEVCVADEEYDYKDVYKLGRCRFNKRTCWVMGVVAVTLVAGSVLAVMVLQKNGIKKADAASTPQQSQAYYKERFAVFRTIAGQLSNPSALVQSGTPQSQALDWMVYKDTTLSQQQLDATQFAQRYAVLVLFYTCGGEQWQGFTDNIDKQGDIETCQWKGDTFLTCNSENAITELQLVYRRLSGQLPGEISLLTSLEILDLSDNFIQGTLPNDIFDKMNALGT